MNIKTENTHLRNTNWYDYDAIKEQIKNLHENRYKKTERIQSGIKKKAEEMKRNIIRRQAKHI